MALKDALKTPPKGRVYRSRVDVWREALDESDRRAFDKAAADPEWSTAALLDVVRPAGLDVQESALRLWRRRRVRA